ncbi:MAG: glycosyltransferase family 2 protein [Lachnospiraceae bacterium]|jgi:glycosyltransferase involved in cell wall biosynthesis|nr:glycosyltransferase family 2 protein [Lachnospiraceae bacterium]
MDKISIVVCCYNEEESAPLFYEKISEVADTFQNSEFEIIFVNDGSKDKTLKIVKDLAAKDERVKYISFSRNFGKEAAMLAGLKESTGDYVAIMDADLQDPPELLTEMYELLQTKEYDCIATRRKTRKHEPIIRSMFSRMFYKIINKISKTEVVDGARDYRLMTRQMVDSILSVNEYNRFSKGIFCWVGFETKWLEYENIERVAGKTKWSFWGLFKYAMDGIIAYSTTPLVLSTLFGIIFCLFAFVMILVIIARTLMFGDPVSGWPSIICIMLLLGGLQLFCIGIIGQYIAKTYLEVKGRPIYIVKETNINKIEVKI